MLWPAMHPTVAYRSCGLPASLHLHAGAMHEDDAGSGSLRLAAHSKMSKGGMLLLLSWMIQALEGHHTGAQ